MLSSMFVILGVYSLYFDLVDEKLKNYKAHENYDEVQNTIITYSLGLKRMDKIEYNFMCLFLSNLNVSINLNYILFIHCCRISIQY